jgi:hypothetical protein
MRELELTDRLLRPGLSMLAGLVLLWYALGPRSLTYHFAPEAFPVAAAEAFDRLDTSGPVFNQMAWGGYLLYTRPDIPVFIDGQTDFYGPALSREYLTALGGYPGWRDVLDRHEVEWTITHTGATLNQLLALDDGWRRAYSDDVATIYRRVSPPPAQIQPQGGEAGPGSDVNGTRK